MAIEKILKFIWNEFIYGGHLLSLGAVSVVFTSAILLDIKISWDCLIVVYLGAQIIYLYNHYKEFQKDFLTNPKRVEHIERYVRYIPWIIILFTLIFIGILLYINKLSALLFGFGLVLLGLFYSVYFKKFSKSIVEFKSFFVSLIWSLSVIFLAVYYSFSILNFSLFLVSIFIFLRLFVHEIFSNIKDIESDKKENLLTLAIVSGKKKMINILNLVNILSVLPIILGIYLRLFPFYSLILIFTILYTFYYFRKLEDQKINQNFLYNVIVDAEFILWSVFILLGEFLLW